MNELRLIIFDVDGTLIDSQHMICMAMRGAFEQMDLTPPDQSSIRACIGMSLPLIFPKLNPNLDAQTYKALDTAYRSTFKRLYYEMGYQNSLTFFDGMREVLEHLHAQDHTLLAVATGKSRAGLERMVEEHSLQKHFVSLQTADFHPSKPHPSMIHSCLSETGVSPQRTVMIGDTSFDMDMGRAAQVKTLGVSWGYHEASQLNADKIAQTPHDIVKIIDDMLGDQL